VTAAEIERRNRSLRAVASALNRSFTSDVKRTRYFPAEQLLVVVGDDRATGDPPVTARRLVDGALSQQSEPTRRECRFALVVWTEPDGSAPAAAVDLGAQGELAIVGCTWQPRHRWRKPMPDPDQSAEQSLAEAIDLVAAIVHPGTPDRAELEGALRLCEACFAYARGVAPGSRDSLPDAPEGWQTWLTDFLGAARAEEVRLFPARSPDVSEGVPVVSPCLTGLRVFVSYAMPTNVAFARPIGRALVAHGATIWFDQFERPDPGQLAVGLREVIADVDVLLLCASAELFENAGYALQELAWALDLSTSGAWHGAICVACFEDVPLPRALDGVAVADMTRIAERGWPEAVVELVVGARSAAKPLAPTEPIVLPTPPPDFPELELHELRVRARHALAWWALDQAALVEMLSAAYLERPPALASLVQTIAGLGWDGTLAGYDAWPSDPAVRDVRLRFGGLRLLFRAVWLGETTTDDIARLEADLAFVADRATPLLHEPSAAGWDDDERRFALRYQLGLLSQLSELLRRGLAGAAYLHFETSRCDRWAAAIDERRRDCVDGLLALRRAGRVPWAAERPLRWDGACRTVDRFLFHGVDQWTEPAPAWVLVALSGARSDAAAMVADVSWRASRSREPRSRSQTLTGGRVRLEVRAAPSEIGPPAPSMPGPAITLGIRLGDDAEADLELGWIDEDGAADATTARRRLQLR
jgi:hypothetical protein